MEMTNKLRFSILCLLGAALVVTCSSCVSMPNKADVLSNMRLANDYFMDEWPDPGKEILTDRVRPSNIWTRGTYYEGLMALYEIDTQRRYYEYAVEWGRAHDWSLRNGNQTRNADDQCCGQAYIDLYQIDPKPERIANIKANIDYIVNNPQNDDWWWIDAIQMAMPVYARLGVLYDDDRYFEKMYQIYMYTKKSHGTNGLYNPKDHLWWRDKDYDPPYQEPNGEDCYWSRGNGWVFAALVRVLDVIPSDAPHRDEYVKTFKEMASALVKVQRSDGFWNVSLHDPANFGGKETTGTAFFTYGFAWGVRNDLLEKEIYWPAAVKGWNAMVADSLHKNGFLGYVQGTGKDPSAGQPVTYDKVPDFDDYGVGAFLLAGSEIYKLSGGAVEVKAAPISSGEEPEMNIPTLFVAGDSTANNGAENGWGSHFQHFFDPEKLTVMNRARGGRSSRTFVTEGLWDGILADLTPGDTVIIQFGHNDAGKINDDSRARGSIPSLGEETEEIDNQVTGKHEVVHTYGWYMRKMIAETKAKGATPIVLSMTARNVWKDGKIERKNTFCSLAKEVASQTGVTFIDLREMIADQYEMLGPIRVRQLFPKDHTHTGPEGAFINAAMVVSGLKAINSPLADSLSELGQSVTPYESPVLVEQVKQWMISAWMPAVQPESDPALPALYTIGDSTVRNGSRGDGSNGEWGWGAPIADFFDRLRLNVENHAMGGTSSRSFRTSGLWQPVLEKLKPGDFVIMQFGHNDNGPINDDRRARGTIKGNGDETEEIDNLLTGKHEIVHSYGWYIRQYIRETQAKGATAIVCSPIPRNRWTEGKINRSVDSYGQWAAQAAKAEGAPFINLNKLVCDHYDSLGQETVTALYFNNGETTHTNAMGAQMNATCLVKGIRDLDGCGLADYLKVFRPQ